MMSEEPDGGRTLAAASTVTATSELKEYFFKLLLIGDACVGKTSYIERYVYGKPFKDSYKTTIGVDFAIKDIQWSEREKVRLQVRERACIHGVIWARRFNVLLCFSCGICQVIDVMLWRTCLSSLLCCCSVSLAPCIWSVSILHGRRDLVSRTGRIGRGKQSHRSR